MVQTIGQMKEGDCVRLPGEKIVYYVRYITVSGAHLVPLNGAHGEIRTKSGRTKKILRHKDTVVVSAGTSVELVDPAHLDLRKVRRRLETMARKEAEGGAAVADAPATEAKPKAERKNQKYIRTSKAGKEMKGQGKIVLDLLDAQTEPKTVTELTEMVRGKFQTRQDDERIVGFYLSKFKREGLVNAIKDEAPAAAEATPAADAPAQ